MGTATVVQVARGNSVPVAVARQKWTVLIVFGNVGSLYFYMKLSNF